MAKAAKTSIFYWLAVLVVSFGIVGFADLAVQQNYRLSANDPQIQMAEDAVAALQHGEVPTSVVGSSKVDVRNSLAPFEIIVDKQLHVLASTAEQPDPTQLLPPHGVFTDAAKKGELRFTWQTADGQRFATVVDPTPNGFVVAARSLKEVEKRESNLFILTVIAWLCVLAVVALAYWLSLKSRDG